MIRVQIEQNAAMLLPTAVRYVADANWRTRIKFFEFVDELNQTVTVLHVPLSTTIYIDGLEAKVEPN